jgi:hypothetical protein
MYNEHASNKTSPQADQLQINNDNLNSLMKSKFNHKEKTPDLHFEALKQL